MTDRVLLVEDDPTVRTLVRMLLEDEGIAVTEAVSGTSAVQHFADDEFDLVLLDVRLPGMSGFDVCRRLRSGSDVPIIMVTAHNDTHDVVAGLELGADDYVTKPFDDRELIARIRAHLRRHHAATASDDQVVHLGAVTIRPSEGVVTRGDDVVPLTKTEYQLLRHMASSPNRLWSRDQLLAEVWGYPTAGDGRVVDTNIARLRAKVEDDPANPELIQTVRGLGYKIVPSTP